MEKIELFQKYQAIAEKLGAQFMPGCELDRGRFVMADGVEFFAISGGYNYKGKIHITTSFPAHVVNERGESRGTCQRDFMPYGSPHFDGINVSDAKTPEQIAKDIQRRFLPEYVPLYQKAVAYCDEQKTYWEKRGNLLTLVNECLKPFGYSSGKKIQARADYVAKDYANVVIENLDADRLQKLAAFLHSL